MVPTSNQWLRSFPIESRSKSFFKWRQDYPLPPSIYRGEFHDLSMKKIGSKIAKSQLSAMFSLSFFSLHRGLRLPPQSPLAWPPSSLPTQLLTSDRAATVGPSFSSFSFCHRPQTLSSPPPLTLCHPPSPASHDHHVRLLPSLSSYSSPSSCSFLRSLHAEFIMLAGTELIHFPPWAGPVQIARLNPTQRRRRRRRKIC